MVKAQFGIPKVDHSRYLWVSAKSRTFRSYGTDRFFTIADYNPLSHRLVTDIDYQFVPFVPMGIRPQQARVITIFHLRPVRRDGKTKYLITRQEVGVPHIVTLFHGLIAYWWSGLLSNRYDSRGRHPWAVLESYEGPDSIFTAVTRIVSGLYTRQHIHYAE